MTNLATVLAVVLHQVEPTIVEDRLKLVAEDMDTVVKTEFENGTMKSGISHIDALSMLAAAVTIESHLSESVENCKAVGDGGRSVGLGQVMNGPNWEGHTRKEICSNRRLQLTLALHVIDRCWAGTPQADAALRCYTSGDSKKNSYAARAEFAVYKKARAALDNSSAKSPKIIVENSGIKLANNP
ncbi:MAG: hypothetical protein EBR82_00290 [Caulobacteraceae bacterium]|nr:hypothetical protein [Caulobacteraceae bacterium]